MKSKYQNIPFNLLLIFLTKKLQNHFQSITNLTPSKTFSSKNIFRMWQSSKNAFSDPQSWEDFIGDSPNPKATLKNIIGIPSPKYIPPLNAELRLMGIESYHEKEKIKSPLQTLESDEPPHDLLFKRRLDQNQLKNQDESSEERQGQNCPKRQQLKSSIYQKNYREKKKQKAKKIVEENQFLKKKVHELQARLRQKQLQLSRIKFSLAQEEWTIQQMNEQMMKKLTLINDVPINQVQTQIKPQEIEQSQIQKKMRDFLKFYEDHGFGGRKKKEVLDYYVNEFFENVMRDREKYLIVKSVTKKYLNGEITSFDNEANEALLITTQQSRQKNLKFHENIRPACVQLTEACRQLYRSYEKVLTKIDIIHQQTKKIATGNIEQTLRRSRGAAWFQVNQYRKEMRNLRAEWIELIKSSSDLDMLDGKDKKKQLTKKKKFTDP